MPDGKPSGGYSADGDRYLPVTWVGIVNIIVISGVVGFFLGALFG